ncbi:ceramide glucosyltransferase [Marinivivus vitaminiproducens]|uniref:ceramide glucosyltransferase n=1 Tax=Marinivivus vitaminiproducens TaxID=3035935 RepID=UPI0027A25413|nr:ceramide glucosyltransferase [Geminicoccaceae bacterium SCSIO 64248]
MSDLLVVVVFCIAALLVHIGSIAIVLIRRTRRPGPFALRHAQAGMTIIRPVCGLENNIEATLRSTFHLDHAGPCQILFCVDQPNDPTVPLIERLIVEHPRHDARLLIGTDRINANPKLNNMAKGWRAVRYDWVIMADSNVLMPRDYVARLLGAWRADTGLVCSPPVGTAPDGFAALLECAFLNSFQARWQLMADQFGCGFAQGKTMLWRRTLLERAGGIAALGTELAEDAAATKLVRAEGLKVQLTDTPFPQPLGRRRFGEVWRRQVRWASLRRTSFPLLFYPEVLAGGFFPFIAALALVVADVLPPLALPLLVVLWYAAELAFSRLFRWPASPGLVGALLARDLLLPLLWLAAMLGRGYTWRGNVVRLEDPDADPAIATGDEQRA